MDSGAPDVPLGSERCRRDQLAGFLGTLLPIQWLAWWKRLPDSDGKRELRAILFDTQGQVNDFDDQTVVERLIHCVLDDQQLFDRAVSKYVIESS